MKPTNVAPSGRKAADVVLGRVSTNRAGSDGIDITDRSSEGRATTIIFDGARVTDLDDGDVLVTIGSDNSINPNAEIIGLKDDDNPTFNFAALVENIVKVGSTYYVPYTSATTGDVKIATASDRDGPWTHNSTIFTQESVTWDTSASLYAPEIVAHEGTYYLFYGMIVAGGTTSSSNAIGVATASAITGPYTDFGAAVLSPSAAGLWDSRRVGEPSVIFQSGQWVMAYMGEDSDIAYQESEKIGIATAPAATGPWTRAAGNPKIDFGTSGEWDDALIADPHLFFYNGYYWIMYVGGPVAALTGPGQQGLAYATDPTGTWTRYSGNPVLSVGASGAWDDQFVFRGGLLFEDGIWSGVYTGYDGANFKGGNFTLNIASEAESSTPVAGDIEITDTGGYFDSTEVEGALQEIGADLEGLVAESGAVGEILVSDTPAGTPIIFGDLLLNEAETDLLYGDVA